MFCKKDGAVDCWGMLFMKLGVAAFVLIVLKLWSAAMTWVSNTNVWWFVLAFVIFAIRAGMGAGRCSSKPTEKKVVKKIAKKKVKKKK